SLDQTERLIREEFGIETACTGSDDHMLVFITEESKKDAVMNFISEKTGFYRSLFEVRVIDMIPKNETGKIMYKNLTA
ncbi:MAG: o-succinylbenzoate--CoA ligase, partial [Oscillospiraceae bacterium]|nr:o-succinylbenzoate--CoA ligase [Oscillospiraceae bacterium]